VSPKGSVGGGVCVLGVFENWVGKKVTFVLGVTEREREREREIVLVTEKATPLLVSYGTAAATGT